MYTRSRSAPAVEEPRDPRPEQLKELRRRILDGVRAHGEVFRWLMKERPSEVFFAAFSETHCAGHHFWGSADPTHPRFASLARHGLSDTLEQVYRAIDREVGAMIEAAGNGVRTMIFAGHGMEPLYHASWNLPEILDLLGFGGRGTAPVAQTRKARQNFWRTLKHALPGRLQYAIKNALPRSLQDRLLFLWYAGGRKWEGSRVFAVPNNDSVGTIRISVKGRDRSGLVSPGEEYRRLCHEIASGLSELRNPVTGRRLVKRISLAQEVFHGPFLDQLPDITVLWDQSFAWNSVHSPRFGTLEACQKDARSGSHTPHGFLLAAGIGIPARVEVSGASVYDLAPTILEAAGVPVPAQMDGRAIHPHVMAA